MVRKSIILILFVLIGALAWHNQAQAGFGIAPPYVKSDKIIPGSHYEQRINLLRSSAEDDLQAEIVINAPEIADWITIEQGMIFDLPKGKLQVPMIVKVDAPKDAALGNYTGHINVRIAPKGGFGEGGVSIALGARVDIDLQVTNESFPDFLVRGVTIPKVEMLPKPWNWPVFSWFFYRVKVSMKLENTGNVEIAPTKVHLDVWDLNDKNLLESHDDSSLEKVAPYNTKDISATFPTKLGPGQYWGKINVYKGKDVVRTDKLIFTVVPHGEGPGISLGIWPWVMLGTMIVAGLGIIYVLILIKIWRYIFRLLYILSWPLRYMGRKIVMLFRALKIRFWRWLHAKSARYQDAGANPPIRSDYNIDLSGADRDNKYRPKQ